MDGALQVATHLMGEECVCGQMIDYVVAHDENGGSFVEAGLWGLVDYRSLMWI